MHPGFFRSAPLTTNLHRLLPLLVLLSLPGCIGIPKGHKIDPPRDLAVRRDATGRVVSRIQSNQVEDIWDIYFSAEGGRSNAGMGYHFHHFLQKDGAKTTELDFLKPEHITPYEFQPLGNTGLWACFATDRVKKDSGDETAMFAAMDARKPSFYFEPAIVFVFDETPKVRRRQNIRIRVRFEPSTRIASSTRHPEFSFDLPQNRLNFRDETGWKSMDLITGSIVPK
jgi:hypothetical protein